MHVQTALALGDVVRERRESLGWTQGRLAQEAGVSRRWVNEFENGKSATAQLRLVLDTLHVLGMELEVRSEKITAPGDADE